MNNIPSAEMSPRIVNGVLRWYEGDTFDFCLTLCFKDQDGDDIDITPDATVRVKFIDAKLKTVKEFIFSGLAENAVTLRFDRAVSSLFKKGYYTYDVSYSKDKRTTVARNNKAVVE